MNVLSEEKQYLRLPDAEIEYIPDFFNTGEADAIFEALLTKTNWRQDHIKVFGKTYMQPRLTALYGDSDQPYSYSNITMHPEPFPERIQSLKKKVQEYCCENFNAVLLNLYRNGSDSNGWHGDNEKELGTNPVIASLSFGAVRPFHFKHRSLKQERYKLNLNHGSLLLMNGRMQHHWVHQIAKTKKPIQPRINLTFRKLINI